MYQIISLLHNYHTFIAGEITNRFFKHADLLNLLERLRSKPEFEITEVGKSAEGRSINLIKCGGGPCKVFLWSQMNGVHYSADIGLIAEECINNDLRSVTYSYLVNDVGDLSAYFAYEALNCETYKLILTKKLKCDNPADLILQDGLNTLLCIENGIITNKNL